MSLHKFPSGTKYANRFTVSANKQKVQSMNFIPIIHKISTGAFHSINI